MTMPDFSQILQRVDDLRSMCSENVKNQEIREISVDLPMPPFDELYFRKAISWSYIFFHETGPFIRFSGRLLRSDPSASEFFGKLKNLVECARTMHAHNLLEEKPDDSKKRRTYDIWLLESGGDPIDWEKCCHSLIGDLKQMINLIQEAYSKRRENESDWQSLWLDYETEKLTHWEAHEFDPFIEAAAMETNIDGLNSVLFRKEGARLDRWRKLVAMFDTREDARNAIKRAIRTEVIQVFGGQN